MRAALTQMDIVWQDKEKNRKICERLVKQAAEQAADIIVFPEMTLTGFTMQPKQYGETDDKNETQVFFWELSKKYQIGILYGFIRLKGEKAYNMLELTDGGETCFMYAKIHPFSYGGESIYYCGGTRVEHAVFRGVPVGAFICYDLRFPEIFQISSKTSQIIFVIANWPKERIHHWKTLLCARAIENQCYVLGVNRVGEGNSAIYVPSSYVFNPYGDCIGECETGEELFVADLDVNIVKQYRQSFPQKKDRNEKLYISMY